MQLIKGQEFEIINNLDKVAEIYPVNQNKEYTGFDSNYLILDFGKKTKNDLVETNFVFKSDKYKITSTGASCGCTRPSFSNLDDGTQLVNIWFDSNKVDLNVSKIFSIKLNNDPSKVIKINLIINN